MIRKAIKSIVWYPLALAGFYGIGWLLFLLVRAIAKVSL